MSVHTHNGLQLKINQTFGWTVMCRATQNKQPNIVIPEDITKRSVTKVEHQAFEDDVFLETIEIPKTIEKIGHKAFNNCRHLRNIIFQISDTELRIRQQAFQNCSSLQGVCLLRPTRIEEMAFADCRDLRILEGQIDFVSEGAFDSCKNLEKIKFFNSVEIESDAFFDCKKLHEIVFYEDVNCTGEFVESVLSKVKIKCKENSWLTTLAYEGFCVETF